MSLILRTATRPLTVLILVYSVFLLLRGHNEPGGGFVGGLTAGGAFALYLLARGPAEAQRAIPFRPTHLLGIGLLVAGLSGVPGLLMGRGYLAGLWGTSSLPVLGGLYLSTPLVFDIGVYLLVTGMTITILLRLAEER